MLGFLTGALIFGAAYPAIFPPINALINLGSTILPTALDVNLWLSILFFVLMAVTLFYFLEKFGSLRKDNGV
jgi:membrane protein implicated in regulation of membrane protease activity